MSRPVPRLLYVTNPFYVANGREYAGEDEYLTGRLRDTFDVHTCLPEEAADVMEGFDAVVVRNSGPVATYPDAYRRFRDRALATSMPVYNELRGKADMVGKRYLLDLCEGGYPVVPTVSSVDDLTSLPPADRYVVKPLHGADSAGLLVGPAEEVKAAAGEVLVQPLVDIAYEVSFYFVDHSFVYALHTPDPRRRWELEPYAASEADLTFARRFIDWNDIDHGVQRVDACRTVDGDLLLLELEDLNPFLSLDRTTDESRDAFIEKLTRAIQRLLDG